LELWQQRTQQARKSFAELQLKYNSLLRDFQFFEEAVECAEQLTEEEVDELTTQNTDCPQVIYILLLL
jgi:hypothetical protein